MRRTNRKLSGPGLKRFLQHFFRSQPGVDAALAERLVATSAALFASVRVRRTARPSARPAAPVGNGLADQAVGNVLPDQPAPTSPDPRYAKIAASLHGQELAAQPSAPPTEPAAFDPYAIGLVPTYQRQGPDGLRAKLAGIADVGDLRKMARAQQIVLPIELRAGEADADAVRDGIVAAVAKRIADRRAAAS